MSNAKQKAVYHYSRESVVEEYDSTRFRTPVGKVYDRLKRRVVLNLSNIKKAKISAVDIGTGTGRFAAELALRGHYVIGLDTSKSMIHLAKSRMQKIGVSKDTDFILADLEYMPFGQDVFNLAVCIHVLRHLRKRDKALIEIHCILKEQGRAIIDMPNSQHQKVVDKFARKTSDPRPVHDAGLTLQELANLLGKNNFTIEEIQTIKNIPLSAFIIRKTQMEFLQKMIENIEYVLGKLPGNRWFGGNFVVSCLKGRS